jgi:hypothetical protein
VGGWGRPNVGGLIVRFAEPGEHSAARSGRHQLRSHLDDLVPGDFSDVACLLLVPPWGGKAAWLMAV